jgi:hypothetical protein
MPLAIGRFLIFRELSGGSWITVAVSIVVIC